MCHFEVTIVHSNADSMLSHVTEVAKYTATVDVDVPMW